MPRNDFANEPESDQHDVDSASARLQYVYNTLGEDFLSLLNSNSRGSSNITVETVIVIHEAFNSLMTRKVEEFKLGLNSRKLAAIGTGKTRT